MRAAGYYSPLIRNTVTVSDDSRTAVAFVTFVLFFIGSASVLRMIRARAKAVGRKFFDIAYLQRRNASTIQGSKS